MSLVARVRAIKIDHSLYGIILMMIHALSISIVYVVTKKLAQFYDSNQISFLYKFSILVTIIPWCMMGGGIRENLKTNRLPLHLIRGVFSICAHLCFFYAHTAKIEGVPMLNISDISAITYLENILVVAIGVLYFKEKLTGAKMLLAVCGVAGACFIIKPTFMRLDSISTGFNERYIYLWLTLLFWAANNLSVKLLGKTERGRPQLFYNMLVGSIFSFPFVMNSGWKTIVPESLGYLAILVVVHLIHNVAFYRSFKFADISTVMPFDYSRLIFAAVLGYIFLDQIPDHYSFIGYALIAFGGVCLVRDEALRRRSTSETARAAKK